MAKGNILRRFLLCLRYNNNLHFLILEPFRVIFRITHVQNCTTFWKQFLTLTKNLLPLMNTTRLLIRWIRLSHSTSEIRVPIMINIKSSKTFIFLCIITISLTVQQLHQSSQTPGDTFSSVINYFSNKLHSYQNIMKICKSSNQSCQMKTT